MNPITPPEDSPREKAGERQWTRAAGLLVIALSLSVFQTFTLIAIPLALLIFSLPGRRWVSLVFGGTILFVALMGAASGSGLWYVERGWAFVVAGLFAGLTLLWPSKAFTTRALAAVAGGVGGGGLLYLAWPRGWTVTDWMIGSRFEQGAATALEALQLLQGDTALSPTLVATIHRTAEFQANVFPALLALSTLAALGVAWWAHDYLVGRREGGLGPLRDFRFDDQLVWVLIAGLALVLWGGGDGWLRAGTNAIVFMTSLYAVRGAAVVISMRGGLSTGGYLLLGAGMVVAAPVIFAGALAVGLGDTWLDIRRRMNQPVG